MTIKKFIQINSLEIIDDLNREMMDERIIKFWRKVGSHLTLRELMQKYWSDTTAEFCVDLGVTFGKVFELYLPFKLADAGFDIEPLFSSAGDMKEGDDKFWELKTGRGKFIQGTTHSPKEKSEMNLIQVLWDCRWDTPLDELNGEFISQLNICVFEGVTVDSVGEHSSNNSRTTMKFTADKFDMCVEACVIGSIKRNRINIGFIKESVV